MDTTKFFKILQWNVRSVKVNRDNLICLIKKQKPDVVLLNETWLKSQDKLHIKNFTVLRQDREDGFGGVATLVHKNIIYNEIKYFNNNHTQYITIKINNIFITNIYCNSGNNLQMEVLDQIMNMGHTMIIMGDLNSHHPMWDEMPINYGGRLIAEKLLDEDLIVINDGSTTLFHNSQKSSAVDLTIISPSLASFVEWQVLLDNGNSDHFPTCVNINECPDHDFKKSSVNTYLTRNFNKANWEEFYDKASLLDYADTDFTNFINRVNTAAEGTIPYKKCNNYKFPSNPWWDEECSQIIKNRKNAIKTFKQNFTVENFINVKKAAAFAKFKFKQKKRNSFVQFCETLNRNSNTKYIWNKIKLFNHKKGKNHYNIEDNTKLDILNELAICNILPEFEKKKINEPIKQFSMDELVNSLENKSLSAPGLDNTPYLMIKKLPLKAKEALLNIYNNCLNSGSIPAEWKKYNIIPILKPGKKPDTTSNFRPIILSLCYCKTLEIMIKNRIEWQLENKQAFSKWQTGFRKGMGTDNNIALLTSYIYHAFETKDSTLAVFLDIKAAYNHVNVFKLYTMMLSLNIPTYLANLILEIIKDRELFIRKNNGSLAGPQITSTGLPQGSPLSTILFNIYTRELFENTDDVNILGYADDLVVFVTGKNTKNMVRKLNEYLTILTSKLEERELRLAPEKCEAVWFTKGRRKDNPDKIMIEGQEITYKESVQYLGMTLQRNLKWDLHVGKMINKAMAGYNVLKVFTRVWWGADPKVMLVAYRALIRSHLDYGSIFFNNLSKKLIDKIDRMQYAALRLSLGCMKSTPTNALLAESCEISLGYRRKILATKFLSKFIGIEQHPIIQIIMKVQKLCLKNPTNQRNPILIQAFESFIPYLNKIYQNEIFPCYEISLETQINKINILNLNLKKQDTDVSLQFLIETEKYKNTHNFIFTDASKKNDRVGFGIHIPKLNFKFSSRLPNDMEICNAEIAAIHEAIIITVKKKIYKAIIFCDSLSAIGKIIKTQVSTNTDISTLRTRWLLTEVNKQGWSVVLAWIPGHAGIQGNMIVDTLANIGRDLNVPKKIFIDNKNIFNKIRTHLLEQFNQEWCQITKNKGSSYRSVQESFPHTNWFAKLPCGNRQQLTTVIRMRTGHCSTNLHLHNIKIKDSPNCECGMIQSLNHIFFECPNNNIDNNIYEELIKIGYTSPLNIECVVRNPKIMTMTLLNNFLSSNNIKL